MKLKDFIKNYDFDGSVVLLEGKRNVKEEDSPLLTAIGEKIARITEKMIFRSGNAPGADAFFSMGVAKVNPLRLEVIKPYATHRTAAALTSVQFSLDDISNADENTLMDCTKLNSKNARLMDYYHTNKSGTLAAKARYILRDTLKVTGAGDSIKKASFALFYDDLENPESGGTGHTMIICRKCDVPFVDQSTWMKWL